MTVHTVVRRRTSRGDAVAAGLASAGIASLLLAWYVSLPLNLAAAGTLVLTKYVRHRPATRWSRVAVVLTVIGLALDLAFLLLLVPVRAVSVHT
ncbi:hypothetical protein ACIHFE_08250 [Streptomyces sp. NPDC052396]|uniref:hypothetical protein n=1 Tax=Streptomyces sp. NPDC052396 TaxID=3365689 RepID=UPI0037CD63D7